MRIDNRRVDCLVAEHVLGLRVERIQPSWYPLEVLLFYGGDRLRYSWDANACNAMIFANGKDETEGYAEPLPFYTTDIAEAWSEVLPEVKDGLTDILTMNSEDAATAICLEALRTKGVVVRSDGNYFDVDTI